MCPRRRFGIVVVVVVVLYDARRSDENTNSPREILSPATTTTPRSSLSPFGLDLGGQRRRYRGNSARAQHRILFFCREFVFLLSEENCTTKKINTVRVVVDECDYIRTKRLGRVEVYSGTRVRASTRETSPRTFSSLFLCPIPRTLVWSPKTYRYLS